MSMAQSSVSKAAGIIQLPLAATQKGAQAPAPAKSTPKLPAPRLKLIIRRLPPGLTRTEFETGLGDEWKIGQGKVDWYQFKPGKISKDPAKPSRPARAYVHVLSEELITPFSDKIKSTSFRDARNTSNDAVLLGPPSVEFAPYARVPGSRSRKDGRQGTIDQDPDFVAFLESLTNPITKPAPVEGDTDKKEEGEESVITPLVQYIKDKKASKAKEASSGKSSKRAKEKEAKVEKAEAKKVLKRPDREAVAEPTPPPPEKKSSSTKLEKATKEAVKSANKQATSARSKSSAKENVQPSSAPAAAPERKRERGDVSAAAKILQRDLGLAPSSGRRRGKAATINTENAVAKTEEMKAETAPSTPTLPTGPKGAKANAKAAKDNTPKSTASKASLPTTPATSGEQNTASSTIENTTIPAGPSSRASRAAKQQKPKQPAVSPTATQAFLKHANPSQGVTEELLEAAFSAFGKVTKAEVDRKKGFGYVDFAEAESLQKAIAASPVTVAQSQVVVLERKNPPSQTKAATKSDESPSQAPPATPQQGAAAVAAPAATQKRSRGPRTRGGRGHKKTAAAGEGKPESTEVTPSGTQS